MGARKLVPQEAITESVLGERIFNAFPLRQGLAVSSFTISFQYKNDSAPKSAVSEKDACSAIRFLGFDGREIRKRVYALCFVSFALRFGFEAPGGGAMRLCIRPPQFGNQTHTQRPCGQIFCAWRKCCARVWDEIRFCMKRLHDIEKTSSSTVMQDRSIFLTGEQRRLV